MLLFAGQKSGRRADECPKAWTESNCSPEPDIYDYLDVVEALAANKLIWEKTKLIFVDYAVQQYCSRVLKRDDLILVESVDQILTTLRKTPSTSWGIASPKIAGDYLDFTRIASTSPILEGAHSLLLVPSFASPPDELSYRKALHALGARTVLRRGARRDPSIASVVSLKNLRLSFQGSAPGITFLRSPLTTLEINPAETLDNSSPERWESSSPFLEEAGGGLYPTSDEKDSTLSVNLSPRGFRGIKFTLRAKGSNRPRGQLELFGLNGESLLLLRFKPSSLANRIWLSVRTKRSYDRGKVKLVRASEYHVLWFHVLWASDRVIIYVNGIEFSSYYSDNQELIPVNANLTVRGMSLGLEKIEFSDDPRF